MSDDRQTTLTRRLIEHAAVLSVTGQEAELTDIVERHYQQLGDTTTRIGASLAVRRGDHNQRPPAPLIVLAGHLDVVAPTDDDRIPRVTDHDGVELVVARGASDMKSGNVVAMELFEDLAVRALPGVELALVLYAGEEGPAEGNELGAVLASVGWLTDADLAIVLEPTDGDLQLGCLGGLQAELAFHGRQAHSARPWQGDNALTAAARFVTQLSGHDVVAVAVNGIEYHDVWTPTRIWTEPDQGRNVVPGRCTINLNFRFAPCRTVDEAEVELIQRVTELAGENVEISVVDRTVPAAPGLDHPIVQQFVAVAREHGAQIAGKQAWTDVARFTAHGIPALNYGPGLTAQAHQRGEYVPTAALLAAFATLEEFVTVVASSPPTAG